LQAFKFIAVAPKYDFRQGMYVTAFVDAGKSVIGRDSGYAVVRKAAIKFFRSIKHNSNQLFIKKKQG
jgi:hypothetical protein